MRYVAVLVLLVGIVIGGFGATWWNDHADAKGPVWVRIIDSPCVGCSEIPEAGKASDGAYTDRLNSFLTYLDQEGCDSEWQYTGAKFVVVYRC